MTTPVWTDYEGLNAAKMAARVPPAGPPTWVPITSFAAGTLSSWTVGYPAAYSFTPSTGRVELRGGISKTSAWATGANILTTLPASIIPASTIELGQTSTSSATTTARVEIAGASTGVPGQLSIYPTAAAGTWVSLDGLFFYVA